MAPIIHCVRHAQGFHNLTSDNYGMHDPLLTDLGKQQCANLNKTFPYHSRITAVVASPIKRTIYTALLSFGPVLAEKNLRIIALPEIQETSDLPCDTGSSKEELEREFAGQPVDFSLLTDDWNSKKGRWSPAPEAVDERARVARVWLRELAGVDGEVVVVTHGGFLHFFTSDWSDRNMFSGTGWANTEYRSYTFDLVTPDDKQARFVEFKESRARRASTARSLIDEKAQALPEEPELDRQAQGFQSPSQQHHTQTMDPATGPAVKEHAEAVKVQA